MNMVYLRDDKPYASSSDLTNYTIYHNSHMNVVYLKYE